ncbi:MULTISPECIES: glucose-1-phosphate thymidylyltransferase RfbA [unclassified Actinopolyspora]|uniref:glucose-1-phosphate thymidylyltransferase RfbA n=1 Tax=unclassified Actinopolyspora TaxID=2639451 RepID=UPI0013F5AA16|nr:MULTISPECIES: glucose-1-phosphate thymidylyltransferase RfbA [unclassified Actinopolyspora]NHD19319.1 glucose-1-phosphate thymidylyltransferase RfbA [Actinopolyspora sp. BKK2]NHE78443.1 glucose-1-phosphate thymidylyltransferase RfbA [Actinopolyspora sp. BKK1]
MKGIILAGGSGSRLHPITLSTSKQLLPIYDKPMIYYPLSVLMLAGIRDILIISLPADVPRFQGLLGDGSQLGIRLSYAEQSVPRGLADAFLVGAEHIGDDDVALVLGDNVFHGSAFSEMVRMAAANVSGATLFGYRVHDPQRYGVAEVGPGGRILSLEEKPLLPRSDCAVTGLYFYDNDVVSIAAGLRPSERGELEITDVNRVYVERGTASMIELDRGFAWLDTGTPRSLMEAGKYIEIVQERQGLRIACIEEVALLMGFISAEQCYRLGAELSNSTYGEYVLEVASKDGAFRSGMIEGAV